jgi:hypothetical protein
VLILRPAWLKLVVGLAFAVPAATAGYHATLGIMRLTMPSETWPIVFAVAGAAAVGMTAFMRLTMLTPPGPTGRSVPQVSWHLPTHPDQRPVA